jgi:hypothetical protein
MKYKYEFKEIEKNSIEDIGKALGFPGGGDPIAEKSGVKEIAEIVKKNLKIDKETSFFIEISLIHSTLSPTEKERNYLTTFIYGEGEDVFLNNIKNYFSSIIGESKINGITLYKHPDIFINPQKIGLSVSYIKDENNNIFDHNISAQPSSHLKISNNTIIGHTRFTGNYAELLAAADKCRKVGIKIEDLQEKLHTLFHAKLIKTDESTYVTIPVEGAFYNDKDIDIKRPKCHAVLFIYIAKKINFDDKTSRKLHNEIANFVRYLSINYIFNLGNILLKYSKEYSLKSAIGSIMSRNGSHNIGSHVLAALSHNVGTMPDDRVLYQYIQQRMDYIATATTERPLWRQPILFVSGIMRQFLIQRHLLNFISGSEGLHAYQFQNKSVSPDQKETIRIHVRRIEVPGDGSNKSWESDGFFDKKSKVSNFIIYPEDGELKEDKLKELFRDKDLSVAIPGGIVGTHAFYTIIENLLRNAAKHEWSKIDKEKQKERNLDIYIDFRDNPDKGIVECRVWNDKACDSTENENNDMEKILNGIEEKIKTSFIEEDGKLRKENWGIAEMRISAGYLKLADIADIGAIGSKSDEDSSENNSLKIIRPVLVNNKTKRKCLGYRFDLFKPRELLVVVPNDIKIPQKAQENAKQYGIWFLSDEDASKEKALPYSYVLFKTFSFCENAQGGYKFPFRILAENRVDIDTSNKERLDKKLSERLIAKYPGSFYSKITDNFKKLSDSKTVAEVCYHLLDEIYDSWLEHIFTQRKFSEAKNRPSLVLDVERDSGNGKKSLVTESDLIHFIFEHSFNSAVRSFKKFYKGNVINNFWSVLERIINMSPRKIYDRSELIKEFGNSESSFSTKDEVKSQIMIWEDELKNEFEFDTDEFESCQAFNDLIEYICGPILAQANAFLAKYEETFVTLPEYFSSDSDKDKQDDQQSTNPNKTKLIEWEKWEKLKIIITSDEGTRNGCLNNGSLCYFRHKEEKMDRIQKGYLEPLSGAQSNMNTIISFAEDVKKIKNLKKREDNIELNNKVKRFATELVENAISRLLIIDERVKKFMANHDKVNDMLNGLGIAVLDHKDDIAIKLLSGNMTALNKALESDCNGLMVKDFDITIIHQGIIDKLLDKHEDKAEVKKLLDALIDKMRYVVITTGRGTPANIPDDARVIPYSVIENSLLKRFPEKLILVNSIMNVLPIGKES